MILALLLLNCFIMSELLAEISKLSIARRVELVQAILSTIALEANEETTLTPTQIAVIEQRAAEIASGLVQTISWEQVQTRLVKRYGLQN